MRKVGREELLDWQTYDEGRDSLRRSAMAAKARRRLHLGESLTLLFENPETIRYQIQEIMRAERIVKEADIRHELETYNELLGGPGEIGATLLIEIPDEEERRRKLREWRDLPQYVRAVLDDGEQVAARVDERQRDDEKASSVQFLKFPVGGRIPRAFVVDHRAYRAEVNLSADQREALREDLEGEAS